MGAKVRGWGPEHKRSVDTAPAAVGKTAQNVSAEVGTAMCTGEEGDG